MRRSHYDIFAKSIILVVHIRILVVFYRRKNTTKYREKQIFLCFLVNLVDIA